MKVNYSQKTNVNYREIIFVEDKISDLEMPIVINWTNLIAPINEINDGSEEEEDNEPLTIRGIAFITYNFSTVGEVTNSIQLFNFTLKNIEGKSLSLRYDSEQGLLYWSTGNKENIISLLSVSDTGARIVDSLDVKQFYWPGSLDHRELRTLNQGAIQIKVYMPKVFFGRENDPVVTYKRQLRTNVL